MNDTTQEFLNLEHRRYTKALRELDAVAQYRTATLFLHRVSIVLGSVPTLIMLSALVFYVGVSL